MTKYAILICFMITSFFLPCETAESVPLPQIGSQLFEVELQHSSPKYKIVSSCVKTKEFEKSERLMRNDSTSSAPFAYAEFADRLNRLKKEAPDYCGYTSEHIVFLVRQSLFDNISDDDNANVFAASISSKLLFEFYKFGMHGIPKDKVLSDCWLKADYSHIRKCELLEKKRLGFVPQGKAPAGVLNLRK